MMESNKIREGFKGQQMFVISSELKKLVRANALIADFYFTAIGYYPKAVNHFRERKNGSKQYIFLYCVDGNGTVEIAGITHALSPNTYLIIPKETPHIYRSSLPDPWTIYWIHFMGSKSSGIYSRYHMENTVKPIPFDEKRVEQFWLIFELLDNGYSSRNLEAANLSALLLISSFIYNEELDRSLKKTDAIGTAIAYMKENIGNPFSLQELAEKANYSSSHYSELFRAKTGFSPINYFNQLKVQRSCQYLYFSNLSIKEIGLKVGFNDPYYFSRLFKKLMGTSPIRYRQAYKR